MLSLHTRFSIKKRLQPVILLLKYAFRVEMSVFVLVCMISPNASSSNSIYYFYYLLYLLLKTVFSQSFIFVLYFTVATCDTNKIKTPHRFFLT